jgi:hypothetical protein
MLKIKTILFLLGATLALTLFFVFLGLAAATQTSFGSYTMHHPLSITNSDLWAEVPGLQKRNYTKHHYFYNITAVNDVQFNEV